MKGVRVITSSWPVFPVEGSNSNLSSTTRTEEMSLTPLVLGVSFEEAQSAFYDEFAIQFFDDDHPSVEERFLLLGMSTGARLLLIAHCEREAGHVIRIISARKATKCESAFYGK